MATPVRDPCLGIQASKLSGSLSACVAGADIMMALDDVVSSVDTTPERSAGYLPCHRKMSAFALAHCRNVTAGLRRLPTGP